MLTITPESVDIPLSSPTTTLINGYLYGSNPQGVIFSNMDTNCVDDWYPVVSELVGHSYMILNLLL